MRTKKQAFRQFEKIDEMLPVSKIYYAKRLNDCSVLPWWHYEDDRGHDLIRDLYYIQFEYRCVRYCIEIFHK